MVEKTFNIVRATAYKPIRSFRITVDVPNDDYALNALIEALEADMRITSADRMKGTPVHVLRGLDMSSNYSTILAQETN